MIAARAAHVVRTARGLIATRLERAGRDAGTAIIEVIFVAVVVMVPLVYLVVAVASVQGSQLAVAEAAREAGRAFATADNSAQARRDALAAVRIALADHRLPDDAQLRYLPLGSDCQHSTASSFTPSLSAGSQFTICVIRVAMLPAVPAFVQGKPITSIGEYSVYIDDYRAGR